jgi:hypothetical protein
VARMDVASDITACHNDEVTRFKNVFKTTYNKDMLIRVVVVTVGARVRSLMTVGIIESDVTRSCCRIW